MTVYLDVIWALNLLFDSLLLYLTAIFLKRRIQLWRIIAGGFIGSLIILLSFTPLNAYTSHPISKLICSMFMVLIAFGFKRLTFFFKALMTLYVSTFLIGGAIMGAHYFIQSDLELSVKVLASSVKGYGDPISWLFVLIGFPLAWHFARKNVESMEMTKIQFEQIVDVELHIDNETLHFKGLVDSGNQLYDPLSKLPVMFVSVKDQVEAVPESVSKLAAADPEQFIMGSQDISHEWQHRLRIIPYKVVGQEHQLIVAIKPDLILIEHNSVQYLCEKGLVSFTMQQLSAEDAFQCIVHPKMLTGPKRQGGAVKVS
ncbi:stage II sporulation protein GA (sporulation sigma-E factor processing peptidase) [Neobacillus bataviensis]|uniref:Stage II sporulation protein GA (Sporulation sigma-E factor processing peptidase) n=1 Tax=Neobacillus bataviensis TaxID=220685 RepID=A0A561DZY2_9BACI|nr:sigma-E processing peptidase SpoIIGA [Neobacillus bataviensis]TWE08911.1 stage II sporulation protein GA (sporulation sigma-E factor processing peptidase) [Neobacillus bataviensis]